MRSDYAVIWDVDGVIIDSAAQHLRSWRELAKENGFPFTDEVFWQTFGMRNSDIMPRMFGIDGPPERVAALGDRKEVLYREFLKSEATALPGAKELMAALHAAGYRQALGSSAPRANIEAIIQLLGLGEWVDTFVTGEDV